MQQFLSKVREVKYLTQTTVEITVDLIAPDHIQFEAGQYMEFLAGHHIKQFAILSVPDHNKELRFCADMAEGDPFSQYVKHLKAGHDLYMRGPIGDFVFKDLSRNSLFIAAGVGVAPFASMIPDALSRGFAQKAQLIFGLRQEEEVFFFDRFTHLAVLYPNFKFTPILSQPKSHWPGETGRITTYLSIHYDMFKDFAIYVSGDENTVKEVEQLLLAKGHNRPDIRTEILAGGKMV